MQRICKLPLLHTIASVRKAIGKHSRSVPLIPVRLPLHTAASALLDSWCGTLHPEWRSDAPHSESGSSDAVDSVHYGCGSSRPADHG